MNNTVDRLFTFNVRGMRNKATRKKIFDLLKGKNAYITLIQEAHCSQKQNNENKNEDTVLWGREWGDESKILLNPNVNSRKGGTAILINPEAEIEINHYEAKHEGRTQFMLVKYLCGKELENILIINCYAPDTNPKDRVEYFKLLDTDIDDIRGKQKCDHIILGGDFNIALEDIDRAKDKQAANDESRNFFKQMIAKLDVFGSWRRLNPDNEKYSWRRVIKNPTANENLNTAARLDYIFISKSLLGNLDKAIIENSTLSDHDPVSMNLKSLGNIPRKKGLWKLNASLLDNARYRNYIEDIWFRHKREKLNYDNIKEWWEDWKKTFKEFSISYSVGLSKCKKQKRIKREKELAKAKEEFDRNPNRQNAQTLDNITEQIKEMENEELIGNMIRSRAKWVQEGEKPTKLFMNLEISKAKAKHCVMFQVGD